VTVNPLRSSGESTQSPAASRCPADRAISCGTPWTDMRLSPGRTPLFLTDRAKAAACPDVAWMVGATAKSGSLAATGGSFTGLSTKAAVSIILDASAIVAGAEAAGAGAGAAAAEVTGAGAETGAGAVLATAGVGAGAGAVAEADEEAESLEAGAAVVKLAFFAAKEAAIAGDAAGALTAVITPHVVFACWRISGVPKKAVVATAPIKKTAPAPIVAMRRRLRR
jgi:hypothetical protein